MRRQDKLDASEARDWPLSTVCKGQWGNGGRVHIAEQRTHGNCCTASSFGTKELLRERKLIGEGWRFRKRT